MFLPDNTHLFYTSRFYVLAKTQGAQRETPKRKRQNKTNKQKKPARVSSVSRVLAPVCSKKDSTIHLINHNPEDSAIGFPNTYPLDGDISDG